ncbi:MAG: hypothetical protein ACRDHG_10720 [Anaerolineales bacterium]
MPDQTLNLLINSGVAGVFAVFAVIQTREYLKAVRNGREADNSLLTKQAEQYFGYMKEQREAFTASLLTITGEVSKLAQVISQMNEVLIRHDQAAESAIAQLVSKRKTR